MSRLNTLYPNDEFLKNISNMFGKVDSKSEIEIKQEIEQIGYKEFYRYYNEKGVYIKQLQQENKQLKEQLEYLRSGEYYNQLRFENEMLQQVVDTNGVPSEVYDYIDCTHRNTELLKENQELKKQLEEYQQELEKADSITQSCIFNSKEESKISYRKCLNILDKKETQQKEFIEWLKTMNRMYQNEYKDIDTAEHYNCVLKKYKEIIGGKE